MAIIYALSSAIFGGMQPVLLKKSATRALPTIITFLKSGTSFFVLLIFVMFYMPSWYAYITPKTLMLVSLCSFIGPIVAWYFYVRAMKSLDITIVHPLVNSYPAISILLDLIFFGIVPKFIALLGFVLIVIGLFYMRHSDKKRRTGERHALLFALITAVLWGINTFLFKIVLFEIPPIVMTLLRAFFAMLFLLIFNLVVFKNGIIKEIKKVILQEVILAGIAGDFLSMFFFFLAIKHGMLYIVLPLSATSPFMSAVYARIFLKENIDTLRISGIVFIVLGGILVGLGNL